MGVSVRVSRNTRVYMPFWLAIPLYLFVAAVWVVIIAAIVLWWLLAVLPARGFMALVDSRDRKREAAALAAPRPVQAAPQEPPVQAPPQEPPGRPQGQAGAAERPRAEGRRNLRSGQWQAQLAARQARRQAEAPGRAAAYRANDAARRERKAARKEARGPWGWPEWTLITALAAFVAFCVVAAATGTHMPVAAGVPLFLIWALGGLIGVPAVIWRRYRARRGAAAMLASGAGEEKP